MKITDIINEQDTSIFVLPQLSNQDPYLQYRFGLALASARAQAGGHLPYESESEMGENLVVVTGSKEEETLSMALAKFGKDNSKRKVADVNKEQAGTSKSSPVLPNTRKYRKS